ncbi:diaminopimelate epimerase [Gramella sp. AN32]|uniref:Diaminopimelate epimerase n=1 Tax=Christiangramia antarctica TaxID=2058158 RepID=A0ABW5X776_9FLAO|nr:diaminopimelate epimerase [Gramella sp. AN32]MCM4157910.1 diaminopimelate epimerase [Gramella sp. AN32]
MTINFYKYQGTGNDFVMVDNRNELFPKNDTNLINSLCDRKFGIGGDGLICLENDADENIDFKMVYFNADGNESSMCGNGGRCLVAFAKFLNIIQEHATFLAVDGLHEAKIKKNTVELKMQNVENIQVNENHIFLDSGSPHHVQITGKIDDLEVKRIGAEIRYSDLYGKTGSNINFVEKIGEDTFKVRTYERGVEDETLSCGTGVTAVALAMAAISKTSSNEVQLKTPGGELRVRFQKDGQGFKNVWLIGPAIQVFKGEILC